MSFESLSKGPRDFPYLFLNYMQGPCIGTSRWPHFCFQWCPCHWQRPVGFNGAVTFAVGLFAIPTTDLLDAFA